MMFNLLKKWLTLHIDKRNKRLFRSTTFRLFHRRQWFIHLFNLYFRRTHLVGYRLLTVIIYKVIWTDNLFSYVLFLFLFELFGSFGNALQCEKTLLKRLLML